MTAKDIELEEANWITRGNPQALEFLFAWRGYVHGIDDLVDGDRKGAEAMLEVFMMAAFVYTLPFFIENAAALRQLAVNCTNAYADSVRWEQSAESWQRNFSDHYRHFGAEMVLAVASICGGYMHMREVSKVLREICWKEHHDAEGKVV